MEDRNERKLTQDEMKRVSGGGRQGGNSTDDASKYRFYREKYSSEKCLRCTKNAVYVYLDTVLIRIDCPKCGSYTP